MIEFPPATIFNPPARECDLVLSQILALGTPPSTGLQRDVAGIGAMPDVTVVAGEDDDPTGISGELQERAKWADAIDRPVITNLLGAGKPIVDGVDDDADYPMIWRQDRPAQVITYHPTSPLGHFFLVKEDRGILPVAALPQVRIRLEVSLLDVRISALDLPRQEAGSGEMRHARDRGDHGLRRFR